MRAATDVPEGITARLRQLNRVNTVHALAQRERLRTVLARVSAARVPVILLDWGALSALVYPSPMLRAVGDIELLVRASDDDAVAALLGDAFTWVRLRHHISTGGRGAQARGLGARIPLNTVWERACPADIESVPTLVLGHEDLLMRLAVNLATRLWQPDGWTGRLRKLCDIGETCRRHGDTIDWRQLVTRARTYGVAKPLYTMLRLAADLIGAPIPREVLADLRGSFSRLPLEERFLTALAPATILADDAANTPTRSVVLAAGLLGSDGARAGVGLIARQLLRAGRARVARSRASAPVVHDEPLVWSTQREPTADAPRAEVAVTYDPHRATDGVGSQLLRIFGLYALARAVDVKYVHTPIARVDYQGFLPMLTGRTDPTFADRYNAFFALPSDDFDLASCVRERIHVLTEDDIRRYRERAAASGRSILLQTLHHYAYTDTHPSAFAALRAVSPYRDHRPAGPIRVCIHLRRGDHKVQGRHDAAERLLPNDYYLRVCRAVLETLRRHDAPFVVRLHTEVPPRRYTVHPSTPGVFFDLDAPGTVDPADYDLEDLAALPNLELMLNVEPQAALDDFATADVLILSLSSLGYFGGLLNPHGLVIYAPWWHPPLESWLVADAQGNLDETPLAARIAELVRRRST